MTLALRYAIRSDVGLLREGNEDAAYAGPRLLAVADGMGGHAAGEVASAAAISALSRLDEDVPSTDLLDVLADAVNDANHTLHAMVVADPSFEGMGTTLTAMLWSDGRVALCHIGDSRAYLLREREFHQITHDHTLVQTLVDEGRISPDDVATHPQRSMLLRALDGRADVEPDLTLLQARLGDRYLLCSDGLSGVVSEETLHKTLAAVGSLDEVVLQLVELAIRGGGPDNITCIVADVVDSAATALPPSAASVMAGAASNGSGGTHFRTDSPAGRAHLLTRTAPQVAVAIAAAVVTLVGIWASGRVERRLGIKDPQMVCVDEVAGVLVTWIAAPMTTAPIASGILRVAVGRGGDNSGISFVILCQIRLCSAAEAGVGHPPHQQGISRVWTMPLRQALSTTSLEQQALNSKS